MVKKCVYCSVGLDEERVVDVCDKCGIGVWGVKMFQAIQDNMNNAKKVGDLYQGSVTEGQGNTDFSGRII
ncbi:MAG: hypothetical protein Q8P57_00785 [Candidatus Pacearchaeota archaeon]|nr:hypothetical protein [Candidatus Pacearchaeota archaeon]